MTQHARQQPASHTIIIYHYSGVANEQLYLLKEASFLLHLCNPVCNKDTPLHEHLTSDSSDWNFTSYAITVYTRD